MLLIFLLRVRRQQHRKRFFYLPVGLDNKPEELPLWDVESYDGDCHRTAISGTLKTAI
jgi:hypothetical protein